MEDFGRLSYEGEESNKVSLNPDYDEPLQALEDDVQILRSLWGKDDFFESPKEDPSITDSIATVIEKSEAKDLTFE